MAIKLVKVNNCEICGTELYSYAYHCSICNKKVCINCVKVLISFKGSTYYYAIDKTVPVLVAIPQSDSDIFLCNECADILKLTLRVLAGKESTQVNKDETKKE